MADPGHLAKLKEGVEDWNRWREKNPEVVPDLSEADLEGADLVRAKLSVANLRKANLEGANLEEADLAGADLREAQLRRARFWNAHLRGADLRKAILFEADLEGAYLGGADLKGVDLRGVHLKNADLGGANLGEADLWGVDLQGADLTRTYLGRADFFRTDLKGANLRNASLIKTNLSYVDLSEANLMKIQLEGAKLEDTILEDANMDEAIMGSTSFVNVDLSSVKGLESIKHRNSSFLSIDSIYKSKGDIPEVFLRGCGVPENFITYMSSLVGKGIEFYSCFISYSHADKSFAQRLHNDLQAKGVRCWLDEHELLPGDNIIDQIDRGIRLWDKVILICSKEALTSWWVDKEVDIAFEKEEKLWKKHGKKVEALIPIDLDRYIFDSWESGKASIVKKRYIADCTGWDKDNAKYEKQVRKIVEALKTEDAGREPAPERKV